MVQRNRTVDGNPTSLLDVGYNVIGLDDNWQACGKGFQGKSGRHALGTGSGCETGVSVCKPIIVIVVLLTAGTFHDADGTPLINKDLFPNMTGMTDYGHQRGLKVNRGRRSPLACRHFAV